MNSLKTGSYFNRYRAAAIRFEVIGGALLLVAIVLNLLAGNSLITISLFLAAIGAFLLIIGGASTRPHNLVKAFAQQCAREPGHEIAQGLLDAMQSEKKIRLVQKSIDDVTFAIEVYECLDDANPELVRQLREALDTHIAKKSF